MLITVYLIAFYGLSFIFQSESSDAVEQQEQRHFLYRYRTLIYSLSLVPSFLLGMFQMRITQLIRRQTYDELYFIILHKQGHMIMYYLLAIIYCCLTLLVACYAIFWNRTLGAESLEASAEDLAPDADSTEGKVISPLEADTRLFLMS